MSQAEPEIILENSGYDSLEEWATAAVRGANNWLVMLRNATDEGIDPWSDEYTGTNGIMSYSEGLIAQALVKNYVDGVEDDPDWNTLRLDFFQEDLRKIINWSQQKEFASTPYLGTYNEENDEFDPITRDFTAAATFATSAIIESLKADVDFGVDDTEIEEALEACLDWLLSQNVEEESGSGWAWVGKDAPEYEDGITKSINYFTYSAVLVLCDLYNNRDIDIIDRAVSEHEDDLEGTIKEANEYLLKEHWAEDRWTQPVSSGRAGPGEELLSSCYAFVGLSYIAYVVDDIDLTEEHRKRMGKAINSALEEYERGENVWGVTVEYECGGDETFTDGSVPYVLLDALLELTNYRDEVLEYVEAWDKDAVEEKIRNDVIPTVLENCWAGNKEYETKGFRHVGRVGSLIEHDDGDPENNMTAIYSTGVAIETFLLNFLNQGESIEKRDRKVTRSQAGYDQSTGESTADQQVTESTTNIILNGEMGVQTDADGIGEIDNQLESIQNEVEQISDRISEEVREAMDGEGENIEHFDEQSLEFVSDIEDLTKMLGKEYDSDWYDVVCDSVSNVGVALGSGWEDEFRRRNEGQFIAFLTELYFCPDRETYEEEVAIDDADAKYLLPPQRGIRDEVHEEWDDADFADAEARKSSVEEFVADLIDEPWGGKDPGAVVREFKERYNDDDEDEE